MKTHLIINKQKKIRTRQLISPRKYCVLSLLLSLILNFFIYFHAFFTLLNIPVFIILIAFYQKKIKSENTRKAFSRIYIISIILCNSFSILMFVLLITAFALVLAGDIDFKELISTL